MVINMCEYNNVPKIRFKGFTDVWEQRKLEDITQIVMGQSPDSINYTENSDDTVLIQGNADLNNGIVVPRIWSSQITKKSYPNDIIFTVRAPVGEIARNPYFATIGRGVASFKGNDFLYQSLIQKKENNYWNNISAGSTFDSINSDQLKNVIIDLPKNNLEQEKIGELFTNLDNLITLHQRKCDTLVNAKKSLLEKMFPKNSSNIPEIRFKEFTDVWEQRKLGDECFELIAGGDIDKTRSVNNGKYPIYANALTNDGIVGYYNDSYRVKSPAVTITGRGEIGYAMARNTDFTPVVRLISLRSKHNNYFLANAINLLNVVSESTGVPQLTIPQVEKFDIYFPKNINEEIKLGRLFNEIDNLITLHQRKLEKLKNIKKSMLDKMFV